MKTIIGSKVQTISIHVIHFVYVLHANYILHAPWFSSLWWNCSIHLFQEKILGYAKKSLTIFLINIAYRKIITYIVVSWESEATPSATPFFKRAYKLAILPDYECPGLICLALLARRKFGLILVIKFFLVEVMKKSS